jgi:hypothetical protein
MREIERQGKGRRIGLNNCGRWGGLLSSAQDADGKIPSPRGSGGGLDPATSDPVRRMFLDNYHTTLVGMMAALMCRRDECSGRASKRQRSQTENMLRCRLDLQ